MAKWITSIHREHMRVPALMKFVLLNHVLLHQIRQRSQSILPICRRTPIAIAQPKHFREGILRNSNSHVNRMVSPLFLCQHSPQGNLHNLHIQENLRMVLKSIRNRNLLCSIPCARLESFEGPRRQDLPSQHSVSINNPN